MTTVPSFHEDLVTALGALLEVPKSGKVNAGQRRYNYMTLPDLLTHVRETFAAHRLAVTQDVQGTEGGILVTTTILHTSGESRASQPMYLRCSADPQSVGSATTYGRRYSLAAMVGLAGDDDDDATHAQKATAQHREYAQTRPVARQTANAGEVDPWAGSGPTGATPPPAAHPVDPSERPDLGSPSTVNLASEKSRKMMWALLRKTDMDADQIRAWVAAVLTRDPDWHTDELTQFEVSTIINRLKAEETPND